MSAAEYRERRKILEDEPSMGKQEGGTVAKPAKPCYRFDSIDANLTALTVGGQRVEH